MKQNPLLNVQDIYPLAPLQEGILFHHLMNREGDPYVLPTLLGFSSLESLERFVETLDGVIGRHDILRTCVMWEGLDEPVQVVHRRARLAVERAELSGGQGPIAEQLKGLYRRGAYRIDVQRAPLLRAVMAHDESEGRWLLLVLAHHLGLDHTTLELLVREARWIGSGRQGELSAPAPFRNFVAQARFGVGREEHERYFRELLGDVDESTSPFGLVEVQGDGSGVRESRQLVERALSVSTRSEARKLGVSAATLMHLAWGLVLSRVSGRRDVVFGTVMFGRMQGGSRADRALGLFINTLPARIRVGEQSVAQGVRETQSLLAELIRHEHAPLSLAQRCSAVAAGTPLFSALLNYRYGTSAETTDVDETAGESNGADVLWSEERTNYPVTLSVDDVGEDFVLTAQVSGPIAPEGVCDLMQTALSNLAQALAQSPETAMRDVEVLPSSERERVLEAWNATEASYPSERCVHELFEEQVERTPGSVALVFGEERVTYEELNERANRLAHYLRRHGVKPDARVAICVERSVEMVVGLMATLKAGGAYVPWTRRTRPSV